MAPDGALSVTFSSALKANGADPSLTPPVPGTWTRSGDTLAFTPSAPFVPGGKYTLTLPAGPTGVVAASGEQLAQSQTISFTVASGSTLRAQQLLASLGYLPLTFSGEAAPVPPRQAATAQPGTMSWRWSGLPAQLTDQWVPGTENSLTKSAVMMFESENTLAVDGLIGPKVWTALFSDVASHRVNTEPLTYVLVTKALPQHLTAWVDGQLSFKDVPVNTGVRGATTSVGTFQVFEHVPFSDMRGTDVTGTKYTDPHVPWASYFNGGDALHGYPRATYGWPQSNGCVEMRISTAGALWPKTPIGTLVTVEGPSQTLPPPPPAPTTTTTKPKASAPTTTTTTKPKPPTTTTKPKPPTTTTTKPKPIVPTTTTKPVSTPTTSAATTTTG